MDGRVDSGAQQCQGTWWAHKSQKVAMTHKERLTGQQAIVEGLDGAGTCGSQKADCQLLHRGASPLRNLEKTLRGPFCPERMGWWLLFAPAVSSASWSSRTLAGAWGLLWNHLIPDTSLANSLRWILGQRPSIIIASLQDLHDSHSLTGEVFTEPWRYF